MTPRSPTGYPYWKKRKRGVSFKSALRLTNVLVKKLREMTLLENDDSFLPFKKRKVAENVENIHSNATKDLNHPSKTSFNFLKHNKRLDNTEDGTAPSTVQQLSHRAYKSPEGSYVVKVDKSSIDETIPLSARYPEDYHDNDRDIYKDTHFESYINVDILKKVIRFQKLQNNNQDFSKKLDCRLSKPSLNFCENSNSLLTAENILYSEKSNRNSDIVQKIDSNLRNYSFCESITANTSAITEEEGVQYSEMRNESLFCTKNCNSLCELTSVENYTKSNVVVPQREDREFTIMGNSVNSIYDSLFKSCEGTTNQNFTIKINPLSLKNACLLKIQVLMAESSFRSYAESNFDRGIIQDHTYSLSKTSEQPCVHFNSKYKHIKGFFQEATSLNAFKNRIKHNKYTQKSRKECFKKKPIPRSVCYKSDLECICKQFENCVIFVLPCGKGYDENIEAFVKRFSEFGKVLSIQDHWVQPKGSINPFPSVWAGATVTYKYPEGCDRAVKACSSYHSSIICVSVVEHLSRIHEAECMWLTMLPLINKGTCIVVGGITNRSSSMKMRGEFAKYGQISYLKWNSVSKFMKECEITYKSTVSAVSAALALDGKTLLKANHLRTKIKMTAKELFIHRKLCETF